MRCDALGANFSVAEVLQEGGGRPVGAHRLDQAVQSVATEQCDQTRRGLFVQLVGIEEDGDAGDPVLAL